MKSLVLPEGVNMDVSVVDVLNVLDHYWLRARAPSGGQASPSNAQLSMSV